VRRGEGEKGKSLLSSVPSLPSESLW